VETLLAVASGKATIGVASLPFTVWLKNVKDKKGEIPGESELTYRVIGHDVLKIALNKDTGITALNGEQIAGIFSGRIKNWKEIGGNDHPVRILLVKKNQATSDFFKKEALGEENLTSNFESVPTMDELPKRISQTRGAATFGTAEALKGDFS